jgi:hypothetical protein
VFLESQSPVATAFWLAVPNIFLNNLSERQL